MPGNLCIIQEELHDSHFKYLLHTKWTIHKTVEPCNLSILDKMITNELYINVHINVKTNSWAKCNVVAHHT